MPLGRSRPGQYEQREWSQLEAVWGRIDPTTLNTTPGAFVLRLFSPSGALLQGQMRTTHVVIIYLNVVGGVVGWRGCQREFIILPANLFSCFCRTSLRAECLWEPPVWNGLWDINIREAQWILVRHLNQKEHIVNSTKLDCCFAFQTSTAQAVWGHCVHFVSTL